MLKRLRFIVLMLLVLLLAGPVFADVDILKDGARVGAFANQLDFRGDVAVSGATASKVVTIGAGSGNTEVVSALTDTVTAADSGTRFLYNNTSAGKKWRNKYRCLLIVL